MCGIAGLWASSPIPAPLALAERMDRALGHRGPDGHGWTQHDDGRLLLAHRRLAIIDPGAAATQPMTTADGRYTIVFNGEVYNYVELRRALEQHGDRFVTRSDTEVLMRLVLRKGPSALSEIRGMFAFALWDSEARALLVARDRFGIKPLYVSRQRDSVAFASEIRTLVASGACQQDVDAAGVLGYLRWGAIPGGLTWVRGVCALEPGTWIRWTRDFVPQQGRFADARELWTTGSEPPIGSDDELRERTQAALAESVRAHLVADVPVGIFLSGGIDSGALVATATGARDGLHTYTVVCDEQSHNEDAFAGAVAQQFGTAHHTLRADPGDILARWPRIMRHMDQPTMDGVNTYFVSSAVAETGVKAVISGIGGDELFGGYPSFRRIPRGARLRVVPRLLRAAAGRVATESRASWRVHKLRHAAEHADASFELYRAVRGWLMPPELEALAGPALRDAATRERVDAAERTVDAAVSSGNIYADVARLESTMYMRQQLLRDADVMSMAHGLEVRVPFVDHQLIGTVWPGLGRRPALLARKQLLVRALERPLPDAIVSRPKQGFTLPFEHWIDGPLAGFVREGLDAAARDGWLHPAAPVTVLRDWQTRACHWSRPWGLAVLGHFLRHE
jgi:asparagine synthase (glutamine-hydrolysing)